MSIGLRAWKSWVGSWLCGPEYQLPSLDGSPPRARPAQSLRKLSAPLNHKRQDLPALGQDRRVEGPLPESAIGNLGAQPFPKDGRIHCLSVCLSVFHSCLYGCRSLHLPSYPGASLLPPCCLLSHSLPDPTLPYPFPLHPPQLSLQGSQSRRPPPPPPAAPSPIPVPSPSPRPSRGPC